MSKAARTFLILGVALFLGGPALGITIVVAGVLNLSHNLGHVGIVEPFRLAAGMGVVLVAATIGMVLALFGFVSLMIAVILILVERSDRSRPAESVPLSTSPPPSP